MAVHGILGKKIGMTQIFLSDGAAVPVTVVQAGPCLVVQRKSPQKDGYEAVQIGLVESRPDRRANQPQRGRFEKAGAARVILYPIAIDGDYDRGVKAVLDAFAQ